MKKLLLPLIILSLLCSSPGLVLAEEEIYWGTVPSPEPVITDDDFSNKYEGQADYSLFREKNIYDVWRPGLFDEEEQAATVVSQPIQEPVPAAPITVRPSPSDRPELSAPARNIESVRPTTTQPAPARVSPSTPKPAETSPGTAEASSSTTSDAGEKPGTKKMRWGQSESAAQPEPKTKFEWGQNKSGAQ